MKTGKRLKYAQAVGVMRKRLERKNNCEVCEIRHGVVRGQTEGRRSRGRTRYVAMEWELILTTYCL